MIVDCISDLHGHYPNLEGGDLLIVAGDLTTSDKAHQLLQFGEWLTEQKYRKKVVIAGNHDNLICAGRWKLCPPCEYGWNFDYLCDSGVEFEYWEEDRQDSNSRVCFSNIIRTKKKLKIWGSPWTKSFPGMNPNCKAFTVDTEEELAVKFSLIPDDTDILITHCPPYGIFDRVSCPLRQPNGMICHAYQSAGSDSLHAAILRINPLIHCFGHIHEGYNHEKLGRTHFVNASHVNERYQAVNPPIRIEL